MFVVAVAFVGWASQTQPSPWWQRAHAVIVS
jgi:hypothetical protein